MTSATDTNPRIYVACLAAYNNGYLHGAWIDADQDVDEIRDEIATMLARGTKMSIFDEPEAGIDLWSFQNLISVFEKMHETIHGSILIISHQERILETADKIVVLVDGEVRTIGTKDEIMPVLMEASRVCSRLADKV